MMEQILKLKNKPILICVFGWLLFPGMYLLVGILTALGASVETAFIVASPAGIMGFVCWVTTFMLSLLNLAKGLRISTSIAGLVTSIIPLAFLGFAFWVSANGGV